MIKNKLKFLIIYLFLLSCSKNYDHLDSVFLTEGVDMFENFQNKSYDSINCESTAYKNFSSEYTNVNGCENNAFNGSYKIRKKVKFSVKNDYILPSNPIFINDKLLIIDSDYNLLVFDAGNKFKKINTVNLKHIIPNISGDTFLYSDDYRLFVNSSNGFVASINAYDVIEKKNHNIEVFWEKQINIFTKKPAYKDNNKIFIYSGYGAFYILSPETGDILYENKSDNNTNENEYSIIQNRYANILKKDEHSYYLVNSDKILIIDSLNKKSSILFSNAAIFSLNSSNGAENNNFFINALDKYSINSNLLPEKNRITFSTSNDFIFAIDFQNQMNSINLENLSSNTSRITSNENQIFLIDRFNKLISLEKSTKHPIWASKIFTDTKKNKQIKYSHNIEGPIIIEDEVILIDKVNGKLIRVNAEDGSMIGSLAISKKIDSPILIHNNKILLISKNAGFIYILY